jgi:hypothetical protein
MKIAFAFAVLMFSMRALAIEGESDKYSTYAVFVSALESGGVAYLGKLGIKTTKCGFGPGEEGTGCIKRTLESNPVCKEDLVLALKQGCAMLGADKCISPPQAGNKDILYPGPRIVISFTDYKSVVISSLACGGD